MYVVVGKISANKIATVEALWFSVDYYMLFLKFIECAKSKQIYLTIYYLTEL